MDAMIGMLITVVMCIAAYFIPTLIAVSQNRPNQTAILALNFLLGWTLVGWVVALVWALTTTPPPQYVIVQPPAPTAPTAPAAPVSQSQG